MVVSGDKLRPLHGLGSGNWLTGLVWEGGKVGSADQEASGGGNSKINWLVLVKIAFDGDITLQILPRIQAVGFHWNQYGDSFMLPLKSEESF